MEEHTGVRACTSYNEVSGISEMLGCCNQQDNAVWWQLLRETDILEAKLSNLKNTQKALGQLIGFWAPV